MVDVIKSVYTVKKGHHHGLPLSRGAEDHRRWISLQNKLRNLERDEEPWAPTPTPGEFIIQYFGGAILFSGVGILVTKGLYIKERPLFLRGSHFPTSTLPVCMHDAELNANNHSLSALALVDAETRVGAAAESFGAASTFKLALGWHGSCHWTRLLSLGASRRRHRGTLGRTRKGLVGSTLEQSDDVSAPSKT
ncbi:uncharacterized protein LOC143038914 [Oratosquilla oratoria]|uniref:uncharacterized protein LOC143038914 n=1 Tax=Oratosquilla oratoria TaxID=337810 RepID=UPI003F774E53